MTGPAADRGLAAVLRVREARERDSRTGLQKALEVVRRREAEAEAARSRLSSAPDFGQGPAEEYRAHHRLLQVLAEAVSEREEEVRRSVSVGKEARRRWLVDRQALRTVELLLERTVTERRQEGARREAARLDELAAQGWQRDRAAAGTPGTEATS
jgi:flagellar export protein FliJ